MKSLIYGAILLGLTTGAAMAQYQQQPTMGGTFGNTGTGSNQNSHAVQGYTTQSGTYVAPHMQTNPDNTQRNNYGAPGNYNPYTGHTGTRQPRY